MDSSLKNPPHLTLSGNEAHLWYVLQDEISDAALLEAYRELMTPDEVARYRRFRPPEKRHEFLVTRALVRWTLSCYDAVSPEAWRFEYGEYGKPRVAKQFEASQLQFNLSNTLGMVACLVSRRRDVGLDVENALRGTPVVEIAERQFAPSEVDALRSLPEKEQHERFFAYWTLKESLLKAFGVGLAFPLRNCAFLLDGDDDGEESSIRVAFDGDCALPSGQQPCADEWQFRRFFPTAEHRIATALHCAKGERVEVILRRTVPFVGPVPENP